MKNILLINPPNCGKSIPEEKYGINIIKLIFRGEPLALEEIAGNLKDYNVAIVDLKAEPSGLDDSKIPFIPDIVGITGVTCEANEVLNIAKLMKDKYAPVVIVGGHHASCAPDFFNVKNIDYIVIGIGKLSFKLLIDALNKDTKVPPIKGVAVTNPSQPLKYIPRNFSNQDLCESFPPAYSLVNHYRSTYTMKGIGEKVGYVVSAYGCTHACNFCSINRITNNKYLVFSTEMVLKNISFFKEDVQIIRLVDANSFGNIKASRELGLEIIKAKLNKNFIADVRSDTVVENPELFGIWKQAGLSKLVIGFEDIHDANLKKLNKKNSRNNNIEAIKILKNLGIKIIGDFIISPEYEENNFIEIENFIKEYEIDVPIPTILTPLPGTALFKKLEDKIIIKNLDYYTFTNAVIETNLEQNIFYEYYAALLKKCFSNIK